jgi:hypothetical protein
VYYPPVPLCSKHDLSAGRPAPIGAPETATSLDGTFSSKGWHVIFENGGLYPAYTRYLGVRIENWCDGRIWNIVRVDTDKRVAWARLAA